ncbi:GSU3473 family protein [Geomesophilobacter sediminis]|uniref:GSU3473 family protein n=1 Tax=Geomesophilobacter sediminis TaxID=2798584 RepID=UPI0038B2378E
MPVVIARFNSIVSVVGHGTFFSPEAAMQVMVARYNGKIELAAPPEVDLLIQRREIFAFCRGNGWVILGRDSVRRGHQPYSGPGRRWYDSVEW